MEEWKEVEGYTSYMVSNTGIVKEKQTGRVMPQTINGGFWCTNLISDYGKSSLCKVHRLVAIAFIPNPEGAYLVAQFGDKLNTSAANQYWKAKKVKPEPVPKEVKFVEYMGKSIPLEDFTNLCSADKKTTKLRLRNGWTTVECVLGWLSYKGEGYTDELHWYPTSAEYYKAQTNKRNMMLAENRALRELEKKVTGEKYLQERLEYRKYGVGNFVNYPILGIVDRVTTDCYRVWDGMLSRCYNTSRKSYNQYGARGVRVCDDWLEFQNFASWWEATFKLKGWHLEKDILVDGNKIYGPETCCFVPVCINSFYATLPVQGDRELPSGVTKSGRQYFANTTAGGVKTQTGFPTPEEASSFYKTFKENHARQMADEFKDVLDKRVLDKLYNFKMP
jgi:hypothetical protein